VRRQRRGAPEVRAAIAQALRYARDFWGPRVSRACILDTARRWAQGKVRGAGTWAKATAVLGLAQGFGRRIEPGAVAA
jgi:hypothetical protein